MSWIRNNISRESNRSKYVYNHLQQINKIEIGQISTNKNTVVNPINTTTTTATKSLNTTVISSLNLDTITKIKQQIKDNSCLDYIDAILYINLEHRKDRDEHCQNGLVQLVHIIIKIFMYLHGN